MASWSADDDSDTSAPKICGIVIFYSVHSIELDGESYQRAFLLCGGTKLMMTKDILANLPRFGKIVIMNLVDLFYLGQFSAWDKYLLATH